MEHYIIFGLAVLAFGSLLLTVGPRIVTDTDEGLTDPFSSPLPGDKIPSIIRAPHKRKHRKPI